MTSIMRRIITLQLRSPLCLARRPTGPGQPVQTLDYITGTALRGGLAGLSLRGRLVDDLSATERADFAALFTAGTVTFTNCLPLGDGKNTTIVPQTAVSDKRNPGWLHEEDTDFGVVDALKYLVSAIDPADALEQRFSSNNRRTIDTYRQQFATAEDDNSQPRTLDVRRRQITRTAVDVRRGTARARQLYSFEALETGQRFRGAFVGPDDLLDKLCASVAVKQQTIFLGQGRSRGLGEVVIDGVGSSEPVDRTRADALADLATFNLQVRAIAAEQDAVAMVEGQTLLPVTLEADLLLRDNYLLPSSDPTPAATLGRYLRLPPELVQTMQPWLPGCVMATNWIGGWDQVRGVPRAPQLATAAGSVWTFAVPTHLQDAAVAWWLEAEITGLGERRSEGYGRVRLCHWLHLTEGRQ